MWTLGDALILVRELEPKFQVEELHLGITGSVLFTGESKKDLDFIVYPHTTHTFTSYEWVSKNVGEILEAYGMERVADVKKVHKIWRRKNSDDLKWCEVWEYQGKRIDVFIMK